MELYTKQLTPNQVFKNYKELCMFLGEEPKRQIPKSHNSKNGKDILLLQKTDRKLSLQKYTIALKIK